MRKAFGFAVDEIVIDSPSACDTCAGSGAIRVDEPMAPKGWHFEMCPDCDGTGKLEEDTMEFKTMNEEVQTAIAERDQARAARDMQEKSKINAEVERDGLKESFELLKNELQEARQDRRDLKDALLSFAWFVLNECLVNDAASMKVLHDKARALLGNWS